MTSMLVVLLLVFFPLMIVARDQTVGVKGTLMCGNKPLSNTEVKLWELDIWPDPDDLLATVQTDAQGRFQISGTENEFTSIDAVVKIYHNCDNAWNPLHPIRTACKRKVTYSIPKQYINSGRSVGQWYDMGVMNMEARQKNEATECL